MIADGTQYKYKAMSKSFGVYSFYKVDTSYLGGKKSQILICASCMYQQGW